MANFYTEIPELKYHLNNPMMKRICELKERNYRDKDEFDYAPLDFEDALDSYDKVLEITGEITGEIINANAEGVDEEGPHCANGRVEYASGTKENLDAMVKAGLNGTHNRQLLHNNWRLSHSDKPPNQTTVLYDNQNIRPAASSFCFHNRQPVLPVSGIRSQS